MCSDHRSTPFWCLLRRASSRDISALRHVSCGWYRPGGMGVKSRIGRPKRHIAGHILVSRSEVFRYWSTARWKALVSRLPSVAVLGKQTLHCLDADLCAPVTVRERQ